MSAASGSANERQRIAAEESAPGAGRTDAVTQRRVRERSSPAARSDMENAAADFSGRWRMKSSENFEELLKALGVNVFLRKIAVAAASSPAVEIAQQGDNLSIKTSTSVRTTHVSFTVGQSFSEATVDGRPCTVLILLVLPRNQTSHIPEFSRTPVQL
ncbi:Cellular retinoic acid-binding protein 2 [Oryzias melastigma]|uniref:Cellular retinoic acid-binding protein 2 n=1 Tax=Oryzias melastigma TaxID=30732 RepID=A0A834F0J5_ORYME|nr:Cellular retinoic acid-binding protein 2 [Oryzias melastigma]